MSVFWIPMIAIIGSFSVAIAIMSITSQARTRRVQLKTEVQMKLIERFGSSSDFVNFVQSEEGKRFLGDAPRAARNNFIGGIRTGIILAFTGVGFLVAGIAEHENGFYIPAFILMGLGVGFFVASMISMKLVRESEKNNVSS